MTIEREGRLRGERIRYLDKQEIISIWYPMTQEAEDDELALIALDVDLTDLDDAITLLTRLRNGEGRAATQEEEALHGWNDDEEDVG